MERSPMRAVQLRIELFFFSGVHPIEGRARDPIDEEWWI
jgi:hypothetical protein